jgi:hypothetical protein
MKGIHSAFFVALQSGVINNSFHEDHLSPVEILTESRGIDVWSR